MLGMAAGMAGRADRVKRETVTLIVVVLIVDALFIGGYFAAGLVRASTVAKVGYTAVWTLVTMAVVLRGITRIRATRTGQ